MLAYINLLIGIDMYRESEPKKFFSDMRALIKAKRFGATPNKAGFQIQSFLSAINLLIHKGVC